VTGRKAPDACIDGRYYAKYVAVILDRSARNQIKSFGLGLRWPRDLFRTARGWTGARCGRSEMNDDTSVSADERDAMAAESGEDGGTAAIWAALHRERAARRSAEAEARKAADAAERYRNTAHRLMIDQEIADAVHASGGANMRLLRPHLEYSVAVVEEDGNDAVRVVGDDGQARWGVRGPMTVAELIHDLRGDPDLVGIFQPPRAAAPAAPKPLRTMTRREWQAALASADADTRAALMRDAASGRIAVR
jgi:hypothetical protein